MAQHLKTLTSLDVTYNQLTKLEGIEQLTALTSLNVGANQLTTLAGLAQLKALTSLDVSYNPLTTLAGIEQLTALTSLNVRGNRLTTLEVIGRLTALTSLNLFGDQLTTLAGIEQLTALTSLNIGKNPLITPKNLEQLTALTSLDVSYNPLTTLEVIGRLTALTSLNLFGDQLTTLKGIEQLTALTSLYVGGNRLTTLTGIEQLTALTSLGVAANQLTTLAGIEQLTALISLNVRENQLTRLPISLGNRTAWEFLDVDDNPLQAGTPRTIEELKAQFFKLQQVYRKLNEIAGLMNESAPMLPSEVNQIILGYDDDIEPSVRLELSSLSEEELAVLKESISSPHTKDKDAKTQKKADDLKIMADLHEAIINKDFEAFKKHLSEAKNLAINLDTKTGEANDTLLHAAALNNAPEFTELLLVNGANPNQINRNGYTPVATAAVRGYHEVLAVYQRHATQVRQALLVAITPETWKVAAIKYETVKDENPNNAELNYKEVRDILEAVLQDLGIVLAQPENQNIKIQLQLLDFILEKDAANVKKVLAENPGVDLNVAVKGMRLLHTATAQNNEEIVRLLLKLGAKLDSTIVDSQGQAITPVHIAAEKNLLTLLKFYRERIDLMGENGKEMEEIWKGALRIAEIKRNSSLKSLFEALAQNQLAVFKDILLNNPGLDVNASGPEQLSLLHVASQKGVPLEFAEQLLALGANPNTKSTPGKGLIARALTPVDVAAIQGRADLIALYMTNKKNQIPVEESTWQGVTFGGPYSRVNTGADADYPEAARLVEAAWRSLNINRTTSASSAPVIIHTPNGKPVNASKQKIKEEAIPKQIKEEGAPSSPKKPNP